MSNEINFIPTRYEDRGDSIYFTNGEDAIVVPKHSIEAGKLFDLLVAPESTEEPTEPSTETSQPENQVAPETTPEGENLATEEVKEETEVVNEEVTPDTVNADRPEEVSTPSNETTEVEVVDESIEGNL